MSINQIIVNSLIVAMHCLFELDHKIAWVLCMSFMTFSFEIKHCFF